MTYVDVIYDSNLVIGFRMEGHAGFNTEGPDILCAALSTASQMTVNGILDWTGLAMEDVVKELNEKLGILHIELPSKLHVSTTVQQLFKSFEMYIEMLEEQYKENITLGRRQKYDNTNQRRHAMAAHGLRAL